jgi:hypothetical protein
VKFSINGRPLLSLGYIFLQRFFIVIDLNMNVATAFLNFDTRLYDSGKWFSTKCRFKSTLHVTDLSRQQIELLLNSWQNPLINYLIVGDKKAMFVYVITFWTFVQLFRTRHAFTYMILKWPFVPKPTITFFTFQIFF